MPLDTAVIELINDSKERVYFYRQFTNCFKCPLIQAASVDSNSNTTIELATFYNQLYAIDSIDEHLWRYTGTNLCQNDSLPTKVTLYDQASYRLVINSNQTCSFDQVLPGRYNISQFLLTLFVYLAFVALIYVFPTYYSRLSAAFSRNNNANSSDENESNTVSSRQSNRYYSVDAFRGITIILMIFVNYGAGKYKLLQHVPWNGLHFADIIFPFFIFIMGVSISISFRNLEGRSDFSIRRIIATKILRRSIKLFLLGILVNSIGAVNFSTIRIPGVLQRFAISYAVVASLHVTSSNIINKPYIPEAIRKFTLYFRLWPEYLLALAMLIIYSYLTFFWQFDQSCPVGYTGPGGLSENTSYVQCVGGAAHKIDELIFGPNHSYKHYFGGVIYDQGEYHLWHDPEGLLGCTTSIILTLFGVHAGYILISNPQPFGRFRRWIILGLCLVFLTLLSMFVLRIPLNKNLWSFSYVTLTGALAIATLALLHYMIDVNQIWPSGRPFHFPGQNSILLYIGHEVAYEMFPFVFTITGDWQSSHVIYLLQNLFATTVWVWISIQLACSNIFFTV